MTTFIINLFLNIRTSIISSKSIDTTWPFLRICQKYIRRFIIGVTNLFHYKRRSTSFRFFVFIEYCCIYHWPCANSGQGGKHSARPSVEVENTVLDPGQGGKHIARPEGEVENTVHDPKGRWKTQCTTLVKVYDIVHDYGQYFSQSMLNTTLILLSCLFTMFR